MVAGGEGGESFIVLNVTFLAIIEADNSPWLCTEHYNSNLFILWTCDEKIEL